MEDIRFGVALLSATLLFIAYILKSDRMRRLKTDYTILEERFNALARADYEVRANALKAISSAVNEVTKDEINVTIQKADKRSVVVSARTAKNNEVKYVMKVVRYL